MIDPDDRDLAPVARSKVMREVSALARRVARLDSNVLIEGPNGSGKERLARWIHAVSPRADGPFVALSCSAIPEQLIESELFGVASGAYTGADRDRPGVISESEGGTLLLDEIADLPLSMQVKLLRALQDREIRPVGSTKARRVDFRLIAIAAEQLSDLVAKGRFRADLFYRLNVVTLKVPGLKDRPEDLPVIAEQVLARIGRDSGARPRSLGRDALEALLEHDWPGNVRELENALERAVVITPGEEIGADALQLGPEPGCSTRDYGLPPGLTLAELERRYMDQVLAECHGNRSEAARRLGIDRKTLYRKLSAG